MIGLWRRNFLIFESITACLAVLAVHVWALWFGGAPAILRVLDGNRSAIYAALASIFGSLLGFGITAVSIVVSAANSDNLAIVRKSRHYPTLWRVFTTAIRYLALATIGALFALVIDREKSPSWIGFYLCLLTSALAAVGIARSIWVLERIIGLLTVTKD